MVFATGPLRLRDISGTVFRIGQWLALFLVNFNRHVQRDQDFAERIFRRVTKSRNVLEIWHVGDVITIVRIEKYVDMIGVAVFTAHPIYPPLHNPTAILGCQAVLRTASLDRLSRDYHS